MDRKSKGCNAHVVRNIGDNVSRVFHLPPRSTHLVLHREGKAARCLRFDEGGDDVWQSEVCYYSQGHITQVRPLIDCILQDTRPRYGSDDGVRAVRSTLATIWSAREGRPVGVDEIDDEYAAYR